MLPQTSAVFEMNQRLKDIFTERVALPDGRRLSIIRFVNECMDTVPDTLVWRKETAQKWYPPQEYTIWMGLFLMVNLSKTAKVTLFGYFLHDLSKSGVCQDNVSCRFCVFQSNERSYFLETS